MFDFLINSKNFDKMNNQKERLSLNSLIYLMQLDVKCFQHCSLKERLICFQLPEKCPICSVNLKTHLFPARFKVPPFVLKSPLTKHKQNGIPSFSLLLQPTDGNYTKFISTNSESLDIGDLHIGITNSDGDVFDFDQSGLSKNAIKWFKIPSIVINLETHLIQKKFLVDFDHFYESESLKSQRWKTQYTKVTNHRNDFYIRSFNNENFFSDFWNNLLDSFWVRKDIVWTAFKYDEFNYNCLDFIITFLIEFGFFDINEQSFVVNDDRELDIKYILDNCDNNYYTISRYSSLMITLLKNKFSNEFIEPEFLKSLGYLNMLAKLKEKKWINEKI